MTDHYDITATNRQMSTAARQNLNVHCNAIMSLTTADRSIMAMRCLRNGKKSIRDKNKNNCTFVNFD